MLRAERIMQRCEALARHSELPGGLTRVFLSPQYRAANEQVLAWMRVRRLPSGAGHDGMAIQAIADVAMLFVRCKSGISHNPAESITEADAAAGARTLLRFIENFEPAR